MKAEKRAALKAERMVELMAAVKVDKRAVMRDGMRVDL